MTYWGFFRPPETFKVPELASAHHSADPAAGSTGPIEQIQTPEGLGLGLTTGATSSGEPRSAGTAERTGEDSVASQQVAKKGNNRVRGLALRCNNGKRTACHSLGEAKWQGHGFGVEEKDPLEARRAWEKACGGMDADAIVASCVRLGDLYRRGNAGVTRNRATASSYYKWACEQHSDNGACNQHGALIRDGYGDVAPDSVKSQEIFKRLCDAGEDLACYNHGEGIEKLSGFAVAKPYYVSACRGGVKVACKKMGIE